MPQQPRDSIHYDEHFTNALGLHNQTLKLNARRDKEPSVYEEPDKGMQIIELLDNTSQNERRVLGHCTFKIYNQPIKFLYVSWVVRKNKPQETTSSSQTVGDMIMEKINTLIAEKGLPAILGNVVPEEASAHNVYERNGWKYLPEPGHWMGYNLPPDLTLKQRSDIVKTIKADDPYFSTHPEE